MKAYRLHKIGDLRFDDIPMPNCPDDWAIVEVKACGICSSDIPRIFSKGTYHFPTIPGHEFSGIVREVNSDSHQNLKGKHVGIFPLIPCRECDECQKKRYELCHHYDYIGSRRDGGFAEYVAVPIWNLIPLNDDIPFTSAAMLEPMAVAYHAIKMMGKLNNLDIAIIGSGMIGIAAAQWAKLASAKNVTLLGRSMHKRQMVESIGIEYSTTQIEKENHSYDVVLEAVGTSEAINDAICLTKPGGQLILMGNPAGDISLPQEIYWKILRKQLTLRGTWNSSYDGAEKSDWTEVIEALSLGKFNVTHFITHKYDSAQLPEALNMMREHTESYCKVMTLWNQ